MVDGLLSLVSRLANAWTGGCRKNALFLLLASLDNFYIRIKSVVLFVVLLVPRAECLSKWLFLSSFLSVIFQCFIIHIYSFRGPFITKCILVFFYVRLLKSPRRKLAVLLCKLTILKSNYLQCNAIHFFMNMHRIEVEKD